MYDQGEALNMVILLQRDLGQFPTAQIPDVVWRSNLFGRATNNLVLKEALRKAYQALDHELKSWATFNVHCYQHNCRRSLESIWP